MRDANFDCCRSADQVDDTKNAPRLIKRNCARKSGRIILYRHFVLILLALACSASAQNCDLKDYNR
jgi:hypothetical protein